MAGSAVVGALRVLLSADTAQFDKGLKAAEQNVNRLATAMARDLAPSQARVNSLVKSFLGSKEIGLANDFARAVEQIGGAAKLTANDQSRVNKVVQEALAHYKALGQQAPKHLLALANATKQVQPPTEKLGLGMSGLLGKAQSMAGVFGVTLGAGALVGFAKHVFDAADDVGDLALKMGVSTDAAQRFQFAARQSGAEIENVSASIVKMNQNLAEGDKSTISALDAAGLKFQDIRGMKPEEAFRAIADAIGRIPDPMLQSKVALELFGKAGADLLPMIRENSLKAADGVSIMSARTIEDLKKAKQEWENFWNGLTVIGAKGIVAIMDGWRKMMADLRTGVAFLARLASPGGATFALAMGQSEFQAQHANPLTGASMPAMGSGHGTGTSAIFKTKEQIDAAAAAAKKAAADIKHLEEAYQAWKRSQIGLSDEQQKQLKFAERLAHEGYPAVLAAMLPIRDVTKLWIQDNRILGRSIEALGDAYQAAERARRVAASASVVNALPVDFLFKGGVTGKQLGVQKAAMDSEAAMKKLNSQLSFASMIIRQVGASAQGAFGTVMRVVGGATDAIFKYAGSLKTAADTAQLESAAWSAGIGIFTEAMMMAFNEPSQAQAMAQNVKRFHQLSEEVKALGGAAMSLKEWQKMTGQGGIGQFMGPTYSGYLRDTAAALKDLPDKMQALTDATQAFGGVAPASLRPMIAELLKMSGLSADLRKQLEGMASAPAWQRAAERAQALGVDPSKLGSGFNQARIQDSAFSLLHDIQLFEEFNKNVMDFLPGVGDELSALVADAIKTGAVLPKTLEPYIRQLDAMGLLLDENGNRIDMGALSFKDIEDEALKQVVNVLKEIRDLLSGALPKAVQTFATSLKGIGDTSSPGMGGGLTGWLVQQDPIQLPQLAGGTHGAYPDWGPGTPVMLHGHERVMTEGEGGGDSMTIIVKQDSREMARAQVRFIPGAVRELALSR